MNAQQNRVIVTLLAAILVPRIEQHLGIKLTADDVADLVGLSVVAAHGIAAIFVRYFPPKAQPAQPAKD